MSKFKFREGDLPLPARNSVRTSVLNEFVEALRAQPGKWAEYPLVLKAVTMATTASNIRRSDPRVPKPFLDGGFDARVHEGVLYVRFVGDEVSA